MKVTARGDLWWKTAVVYCLDVETFMDWNDDGSGDFEGLEHRLDHLADLGVTCLWLMPFQPSPNLDDGYDITDFQTIDPRLGSLGDFVEFIRTRPRPGHARHHRLRHEPHLGPASLVPLGASEPQFAVP
ncbi:alpha-amylase family glycosyl hydrolase [Agromyces albus]|uniref:alpha-amylase family glycosyl hydrolase n=1 Tax=Agromyces albus TaxID=205332 RepID=UPI00278AB39F|nr:alpha-amylase family glycosyl hydrolase [Agromyces albus]MDQ0575733.1 1,4-alpha-glucan branching enzyme [Agromyces albus]